LGRGGKVDGSGVRGTALLSCRSVVSNEDTLGEKEKVASSSSNDGNFVCTDELTRSITDLNDVSASKDRAGGIGDTRGVCAFGRNRGEGEGLIGLLTFTLVVASPVRNFLASPRVWTDFETGIIKPRPSKASLPLFTWIFK